MNGYISYMDVLGFNNKINAIDVDFKTKYEALITKIGTQFHPDPKATIYVVSDSIIVTSQNFKSVKAYTRMIYEAGMLDDFWLRGAITQGDIETIDATKIVRENKNIIMPYMGDAYITAYNLESKLNMAGIVIDDDVKSDNPDLPLEIEYVDGFMEYQEYLPKAGNENKKRLLVPSANKDIYIADSLHFGEMLKSHADDIDKYVNTFCFYIKLLLPRTDAANVSNFLSRLIDQLSLHGRHFLIPRKVIIIFIAVVDAMFERYNNSEQNYSESSLKANIGTILDVLKAQGCLLTFSEYLLEFDKKRATNLYEKVHTIPFDKGKA